MAFSADYGTAAANYKPDVLYTGIGKFAKELIDSERVTSRFSSLFKEGFTSGKDLEVKVYKKATGVDYSATNAPEAPYPVAEVLCFKGQTRRTYPTKIDEKDCYEAAIDEAHAREAAEKIVQTLYTKAFDEENGYAMAVFKDAKAASNQIIDWAYQYNDTDSEKGARELLKQIKYVAGLIRKGETIVNPHGLNVAARSVKMIVPLIDAIGIDVYARMSAYNESFAAYGVDEVITYTPDDGEEGEIYIFDNEYAQFAKAHPDSYKEQPIAGCDNYNAFLHRYIQYAGCPLFSCVRIKRKANPTDNSIQTVNAIMYGTKGGDSPEPVAIYAENGQLDTIAYPAGGGNIPYNVRIQNTKESPVRVLPYVSNAEYGDEAHLLIMQGGQDVAGTNFVKSQSTIENGTLNPAKVEIYANTGTSTQKTMKPVKGTTVDSTQAKLATADVQDTGGGIG